MANRQYEQAKSTGARAWTTVYFGQELGAQLAELSAKTGMSMNKLCQILVRSAIDKVEIKTRQRTITEHRLVIDGKEYQ